MTAQVLFGLLRRKAAFGKLVSLMLVCAALLAMPSVNAAISGDQVETEEDLRQYVAGNTQRMIGRLEELRESYDVNDEEFYREMEAELANFVDFRRIAGRVMARYARQASKQQRDAFVVKFKRSLFETYSRALAETEDFEVNVTGARFLAENDDRAAVDLTVTSESGTTYNVSYSLFEDDSGSWMMENIIVEGVNIGLAFRDRFQQQMEERRGNLQAVIDNWSGEIEELEEKTEQKARESNTGG